MASLAALLAVSFLAQVWLCGAVVSSSLDVTRFFSFNASSTCGETSTIGSGFGAAPSCLLNERNTLFASDGDLNTWWQSEDGVDPVELTFSLQNLDISLDVVGLRLIFRDALPLSLRLETRPLSSEQFTFLQLYTADGSCDLNSTTCSDLSTITVGSSSGNITTLEIPVTLNEPLGVVRLLASEFQSGLPLESQHYSLSEAQVFANIASGYFVRSLHAIRAAGGDAVFTDTGERVPIGNDQSLFPGSRGHAVLNFGDDILENVQFVFPSIPRAGRYRIIFLFGQVQVSRRPVVMVMQAGMSVSGRVSFHVICNPACYVPLVSSQDVSQVAVLDLVEGPLTVQLSLSSINILIDAVIAIPDEFFTASMIPNGEQFAEECGTSVTTETFSSDLCRQGAQQLSLNYYERTHSCDCGGVGAVEGETCEAYGGQCPCVEASEGLNDFIGRQCDLCPYYSYLTPQGCTVCECPDSLDMCDVMTGQCSSCPPLVVGRSCEMCIENSFGDPAVGCEPCGCDLVGSESCDAVSGECECKARVNGTVCDRCAEGSFNFSSDGCEACECDSVGSEGVSCDETGQCTCKAGVGGLECSQCLPGYFAFSDSGCVPCNCSGRASSCALSPDSDGSTPLEVCDCPHPYTGASCDDCVIGFFLSAVSGECEVCQCNDRAESCAAGSGECIDCMDDTAGSSCERCMDGFYDSGFEDDIDCLECPCDSITTTNSSCLMEPTENTTTCFCLPGHRGPFCDMCDDGYYGNPPEYRCTSCECNGNIDPDTPMSCDQDTGVCRMCINNSTGDECQFCADGFFGNATVQDCQPCRCLGAGSANLSCDWTTGQCSCLDGVGGQSCDQCQAGFWNFTAGVGCEVCDCGEGSTSALCDTVTGQCPCSSGVGGADCSSCLDGFYNFTAEGCSACECGVGAVNSSCTSDGRCYCQSGVTGVKCDQCASFHMDLTSSGCEPCGACEQMIRDKVGVAVADLTQAEGALDLFGDLYQADQEGCGNINQSLTELNETVVTTTDRLDTTESQLDALDSGSEQIQETVNNTLADIEATRERVRQLFPYAESVHEHIQNVYNTMQDVLIDIGTVNLIIQPIISMLDEKAARSEVISGEIANVSNVHNEDFSAELLRAGTLLTEVIGVSDRARLYLQYARNQLEQAVNVSFKYQRIGEEADGLMMQIVWLQNRLNETTKLFNAVSTSLQQLMMDVSRVNDIIAFANGTLETADSATNELQIALMRIQNHIQEFGVLLGQEDFASGFGSGSGSGMDLMEPATSASPATTPTNIIVGVALLRQRVDLLRLDVDECEEALLEAEEDLIRQRMLAQRINNTLSPSLSAGNSAVSAIIDYIETLTLIQEALNITSTINSTLQQVQSVFTALEDENFEAQVALSLQNAQLLMSQAEAVREGVANLTVLYERTRTLVETDTNRTETLEFDARRLRSSVNSLSVAAGMFGSSVADILAGLNVTLTEVVASQEYVEESVSQLQTDVFNSITLLEEAQSFIEQTDALIGSTNSSLLETRDHVRQTVDLLNTIQRQSLANSNQLDSIATSVNAMSDQLAIALRAAASIDIALSFNGDTQHSYPAPAPPPTNTTTISLAFRPTQTDYGTLFYSESGMESSDVGIEPSQGGVSLRLFNGSVQFEYDGVGVVSTEEELLREDEWYQLYATRDSSHAYLSVAPLQGGIPSYSFVTMTSPVTSPLIAAADVIVLGGGQDDRGPVVPNTDGFVGCIDRVVVNNEQLSLLLPNAQSSSVAVCEPRPPADIPRAFETGSWLQGADSYLQLPSPTLNIVEGIRLSLSLRILSQSGTVLYLTSQNLLEYIAVFLMEGRLVLEYSQTGMDSSRVTTLSTYHTGQWYGLFVDVSQQGASLSVNGSEVVTVGTPIIMPGAFNSSNFLFIGGVSSQVDEILGVSRPSLPGCVRDIIVNDQQLDLMQNVGLHRVVLGGCPAQVSAGVRFMGNGYGEFTLTASELLDDVRIEFRSTQLAASLLQLNSEPPVSISLYHTRVRVDVGTYSWVSGVTGLNDNRWHTLSLSLANLSLTLDGELNSLDPLPAQTTPPSSLLIGGSPEPGIVLVGESFRGCVRNVRVNARTMDFNSADTLVGVALYGCRSPSLTVPTPPPPPPLPPPPTRRPNITVGLDGADSSFIAVRLASQEVLLAFSISVEFRTSSAEALLLYSQDIAPMFADYLSLELRGGRLIFSYNLGSGRVFISSNETYNDGQLHTAEITRAGRTGELSIDEGTEYVTGSSPGSFSHLNIYSGLLFVGGVPSILNTSLIWPGQEDPRSAQACFHMLSINGIHEDITDPHATSGASPVCLDSYNNLATFGVDSYLQILDKFDGGTSFSFSLRFRTSSCTGLLLYSHSLLYPDHLVVELLNGTMRFVFDNGPRETLVESTPTSPTLLCDNEWHTLVVEKDGVRGVVTVDGGVPASAVSPHSSFRAVNVNDPLYVGGTPATLRKRLSSLAGSFVGCIGDVYVRQGNEGQRGLLLAQAVQEENVIFNTCELNM